MKGLLGNRGLRVQVLGSFWAWSSELQDEIRARDQAVLHQFLDIVTKLLGLFPFRAHDCLLSLTGSLLRLTPKPKTLNPEPLNL